MRMIARLAAVAALAVLAIAPAAAREVTEEEAAALSEAVDAFDTAMQTKNIEGITAVVPPKVLDKIASQNGLTSEALMEAMVQQVGQLMENVTLTDFGMDLDAAEYLETADGTPYALIPTHTTIDAGAGKVDSSATTLGLLDGEDWYLVRTDDAATIAILKEVYPQFADVEFPQGTLEPAQ